GTLLVNCLEIEMSGDLGIVHHVGIARLLVAGTAQLSQVFFRAGDALRVGNRSRFPRWDYPGNCLVDVRRNPGLDLLDRHKCQTGRWNLLGRVYDLTNRFFLVGRGTWTVGVVTDYKTLAVQLGE